VSQSRPLREGIIFLVVTLSLSLLVFWGPIALLGIPAFSLAGDSSGPVWALVLFLIGGFTPSLTAIAMTAIHEGGAGLRRLLRRVVQVRLGWRWYLAAVVVVVLGTAGQIAAIRLLGGAFDLSQYIVQLGSALPLILLGPLSEELGWRGYALGRLQTRMGALTSSVVIGIVWALWHLPLFFMVGTSQNESNASFLAFAVAVVATSVLYTWLYNNTGGSIWSAVFLHWIYTYAVQVVWTAGDRPQGYDWLEPLPYVVLAVAVTAIWGPKRLTRQTEVAADN